MAKKSRERGLAEELLRQGIDLERKLLKRERRAERSLLESRVAFAEEGERLARIERKIERLRASVTTAEDELRQARAARAAEPEAPLSVHVADEAAHAQVATPTDGAVVAADKAAASTEAETRATAAPRRKTPTPASTAGAARNGDPPKRRAQATRSRTRPSNGSKRGTGVA